LACDARNLDYVVRNLVCWAHKLALLPIGLAGYAIWFISLGNSVARLVKKLAELTTWLELLANELGGSTIWFTVLRNGDAGLVNKFADVTNRLVTVAIWFTGLAMRLAWLAI